ncbi:MAG: hypothetical protein R3234_11785, partial [Thermoanaerobaculia bacterium]|nr:hypothetical protein [Thermoanaerobaculia bacterium]
VAASPLHWHTESLGLRDLPRGVWGGAGWLTRGVTHQGPARAGMEAGVLLGFLPWIKLEGGPLAVFLLMAGCLSTLVRREPFRTRVRRCGWLLAPALLWILAAFAVSRIWLPRQADFFRGAWLQRTAERLADPTAILLPMARDLLRPEWIGLWVVFAAGWIFALVTRRRRAAILGTAIVLQLGVYTATYFATYLPPGDHVRSSFFRIAAALAPLGILVLAEATLGELPATREAAARGPGSGLESARGSSS